MTKLDISSTALEKSVEIAKDFLDKLVTPAVEEVGLLLRDTVALWKFKNQVRVLNRARAYCEANGISPDVISLKLLCPLLENAALEEDEQLQDRWAILLSNLVDSDQNIQNHVFPYILSQISTTEFSFLEQVYFDKRNRVAALTEELQRFREECPALADPLKREAGNLTDRIEKVKAEASNPFSPEVWTLQRELRGIEAQLHSLRSKEASLVYRIAAPEPLPEENLREYELSNIVRLGLARAVQETYANSQTLEIPVEHDRSYVTVDLDVELESDRQHVLTELGELFVAACTEKRNK